MFTQRSLHLFFSSSVHIILSTCYITLFLLRFVVFFIYSLFLFSLYLFYYISSIALYSFIVLYFSFPSLYLYSLHFLITFRYCIVLLFSSLSFPSLISLLFSPSHYVRWCVFFPLSSPSSNVRPPPPPFLPIAAKAFCSVITWPRVVVAKYLYNK